MGAVCEGLGLETLSVDIAESVTIAPGLPPELAEALVGGLEMLPEMRIPSAIAFAEAIGVPISERGGESLAQSLGRAPVHRRVIEAIVRTAARSRRPPGAALTSGSSW